MVRYQDLYGREPARDALGLSREREDADLLGVSDEYRRRALERADRLREVSDAADMSWPSADISVERVRPARRDENADQLAAARGVFFGMFLGALFWIPTLLWALPAVREVV